MAQTVGTKGYAGASPVDVCATAGVSTKAFYEQFSDKEDCFLATFDRGVELLTEKHRRRVPAAGPVAGADPPRARVYCSNVLAGEPAFARWPWSR